MSSGARAFAQDDTQPSPGLETPEERELQNQVMLEAIQRASELWKAGDFAGRIQVFEDACRELTVPSFKSTILLSLADALRNQGKSVSALRVLRETEKIVTDAARGVPDDGIGLRLLCYLRGVETQIYLDWGLVDIAHARSEELKALVTKLAGLNVPMDAERVQFNWVTALVLLAMKDSTGLERHVTAALADDVYTRVPHEAGLLHERLGVRLSDEARIKPALAARAREELELALSDKFGARAYNRVSSELELADLAARESDMTTARKWFDLATEHIGAAKARATHPSFVTWTALAARLVYERKTPPPERAELEAMRSQLEETLRSRLDTWRSTELRRGGYGILRYHDVRSLISELVRIDIALEPGRAGVERALSHLIAADEVATLARTLAAANSSLVRARAELLAGKSDHALLWYFRAPDRSHLFVVGQDSAEHFMLAGADIIDAARLDAVETVQRPADDKASAARLARRSDVLSKLASLLLPLEARPILAKAARMTVVGLDLFETVPFEALPWGDKSTLGASKAIAHLPSLAAGLVLAERARSERPARADDVDGGVLLLASPASSDLDISAARSTSLVDSYPKRCRVVATRSDASIERLAESASAARILQIVTHGRYDTTRECPATMLLDAKDEKRGVLVGADELERIDAPPLVVLTSCRSGIAPTRRGDSGAADLAGAVFLGGKRSRCVVLSAFDLDVEAALRISTSFHAALAKGVDPAEALRMSSAELSADPKFADPFYYGLIRIVGIGHVPIFAR